MAKLYFLRCDDFVKVGYASNFASRFSSIQTANPFEVSVVGLIEFETPCSARAAEGRLHRWLKSVPGAHVSGEWFSLGHVFALIRDYIPDLYPTFWPWVDEFTIIDCAESLSDQELKALRKSVLADGIKMSRTRSAYLSANRAVIFELEGAIQ